MNDVPEIKQEFFIEGYWRRFGTYKEAEEYFFDGRSNDVKRWIRDNCKLRNKYKDKLRDIDKMIEHTKLSYDLFIKCWEAVGKESTTLYDRHVGEFVSTRMDISFDTRRDVEMARRLIQTTLYFTRKKFLKKLKELKAEGGELQRKLSECEKFAKRRGVNDC